MLKNKSILGIHSSTKVNNLSDKVAIEAYIIQIVNYWIVNENHKYAKAFRILDFK